MPALLGFQQYWEAEMSKTHLTGERIRERTWGSTCAEALYSGTRWDEREPLSDGSPERGTGCTSTWRSVARLSEAVTTPDYLRISLLLVLSWFWSSLKTWCHCLVSGQNSLSLWFLPLFLLSSSFQQFSSSNCLISIIIVDNIYCLLYARLCLKCFTFIEHPLLPTTLGSRYNRPFLSMGSTSSDSTNLKLKIFFKNFPEIFKKQNLICCPPATIYIAHTTIYIVLYCIIYYK